MYVYKAVGEVIRQINTCRKVPLQVNFLDDDILLCCLYSSFVNAPHTPSFPLSLSKYCISIHFPFFVHKLGLHNTRTPWDSFTLPASFLTITMLAIPYYILQSPSFLPRLTMSILAASFAAYILTNFLDSPSNPPVRTCLQVFVVLSSLSACFHNPHILCQAP
jgi:hypothetical protein